MKKVIFLLVLSSHAIAQDEPMVYPKAHTDSVRDCYFGTIVTDPYRGLEDDSLQTTQQWLREEQELSEKYLIRLKNKYNPEKQLRLNGYVNFGTTYKSGKYYFDWIRESFSESSCVYIKKRIDIDGDKIIDPDDYKNDKKDHAQIGQISVSEDNKHIAFSVSHNGSDWKSIRVKTLYPSHKCSDQLEGVKFSNIEWAGNGFFYKRYAFEANMLKDSTRQSSIWYHTLGDDQVKDILIYQDNLYGTTDISFNKMSNGKYLIIYSERAHNDSISTKNVLAINLNNFPSFKIDTIISTHYSESFNVIGIYKDKFLATTTLGAPHGKCVLLSLTEKNIGEDFIPEHTEIQESVNIVGNKVLVTYMKDADYINVNYDSTGKALKRINFPVGCSADGFTGNDNSPNDSITIFYFNSFLFPIISYQYNVNTLEVKLIEKTTVTYDYKNLEIKKVFFTSKDGTRVPMFIASKKGIELDGSAPTLLYGYGGYGVNMTPFYSRGFISFMQNGGIVALPCLRGGGEYGADWHKKGSRLNKQNVFDDFIGAAEYLFKEHYTSSEHLALMGGSNGGLLVAAVVNQRPDICKAAIAIKGVYDMLRYQKYTIGHAWIKEYGSCDDSLEFNNLIKYSPLQNVKNASYPAILIITSDHDDRVVPLHSYKYAAQMQQKNKSSNPILLYVEKKMGHTSHTLSTDIYTYSFIYDNLKVPTRKLHTLEY